MIMHVDAVGDQTTRVARGIVPREQPFHASKPPVPPSDEVVLPLHLRLGISKPGFVAFLFRIDFFVEIEVEEDTYEDGEDTDPIVRALLSEYSPSYNRDEHSDMAWIGEAHGPDMTGYDLCFVLRKWLREQGHSGLSVCEVILKDPRFEDLRKHVKPATIFYSHLQLRSPQETFLHLETSACVFEAKLPPAAEQYWWIDYFSLRQCVNDFKTKQVIILISEIGTTVAEVDEDLQYLRRSFCILELYATVAGNAHLLCVTAPNGQEDMEKLLAEEPIDSEAAQTRRAVDKETIDEYIRTVVGFNCLDKLVHGAAIMGGRTFDEFGGGSEGGSGSESGDSEGGSGSESGSGNIASGDSEGGSGSESGGGLVERYSRLAVQGT
jgi:hypothetical protein